ncbi:transcription repressor OFP7-like [Euphorbia lathyris]|uniref:transcription repressor OFP7-like n=1 Tax=Euphorbia lathyris TaxID=212925 RepID=UPI0033140BD9
MSKRFKLKLSRAVPSFQICRSKILSETQSPIPAIYKLSRFHPKQTDISYPNLNLPDPPPSTPNFRRKLLPRHPRSLAHFLADISIESPDFARKEDGNKWPAAARQYIQSVSFSDDSFESFCSVVQPEKQNADEIGVTVTPPEFGNSDCCFSCEADDEEEEGKEEDEDETSLLFSSRSFSCDFSHDFSYPVNAKILDNGTNRKTRIGKVKRQVSNKKYWKTKTALSPDVNSPIRSSVLRRMISCSTDHGKVKESVAVVKKSEDPYEDFKRSMLEMILEKQMFEGKDLEELLQCFLTLNSRKYHEVIVKAFSEIWEILFCDSPVRNTNSKRLSPVA